MKTEKIREKIFIQPQDENFDEFLKYATENDYNLEIATFASSDVLDTNWESILKKYKNKLKSFKGVISTHGTFRDLFITSRDAKIRKVAEERIYHNLEIAKELNAKYIVFHGNFNSHIGHKIYEEKWIKKNIEFWKKVVKKYKIIIVLENLWEPHPELFKGLIRGVNSPFLKVCFDTGHANIFSKVPAAKWFSVLKDDIVYIHVNDNKGKLDSELIPGKGNINWKAFSATIKKNKIKPNVVFEVGSLEKTIKSINYFKKNKIYPF